LDIVIYYLYRKTIEPKAALPSDSIRGATLRTKERRDSAMITYSEFFQFCIFIVALINLIYLLARDHFKGGRKKKKKKGKKK